MAKGWLEDYANQLKIIVLRQALVNYGLSRSKIKCYMECGNQSADGWKLRTDFLRISTFQLSLLVRFNCCLQVEGAPQ